VLEACFVMYSLLDGLVDVLVTFPAERSAAELCFQLLDLLLVELERLAVGVFAVLAVLAQTVLVLRPAVLQLVGLLL